MNSPHASCVDKGHRAIAKTNAVRVAGPGRICFLGAVVGCWSSVVGCHRLEDNGLPSFWWLDCPVS
jgi:hypothetical protein